MLRNPIERKEWGPLEEYFKIVYVTPVLDNAEHASIILKDHATYSEVISRWDTHHLSREYVVWVENENYDFAKDLLKDYGFGTYRRNPIEQKEWSPIYKVGDWVRIIEEGKSYTGMIGYIKKIETHGQPGRPGFYHIYRVDLGEVGGYGRDVTIWYDSDLEPYAENPIEQKEWGARFKVGDRVQVTDTGSHFFLGVGIIKEKWHSPESLIWYYDIPIESATGKRMASFSDDQLELR